MNNIDEILQSLGINSPDNIQAVKADIESYALELAFSKLIDEGTLSDADKINISKVQQTGTMDEVSLLAIFNDQRRQDILQQSLSEAIATAIDASSANQV